MTCPGCGGAAWVLDGTDADGEPFYRPCGSCHPELFDLWRGGHLAPGHSCSACASSRPSSTKGARTRTRARSTVNADMPAPPLPLDAEPPDGLDQR